MKQLMLGNEAVARGLYEAGCSFVSSYPGTPSTEITEYAAKYKEIYAEWAPNEKVAVEAAFGACVAGKRSFCSMKHVGLNVAADPVFTIAYTGVNAGMITLLPQSFRCLNRRTQANPSALRSSHTTFPKNTIHPFLSRCVQELLILKALSKHRTELRPQKPMKKTAQNIS